MINSCITKSLKNFFERHSLILGPWNFFARLKLAFWIYIRKKSFVTVVSKCSVNYCVKTLEMTSKCIFHDWWKKLIKHWAQQSLSVFWDFPWTPLNRLKKIQLNVLSIFTEWALGSLWSSSCDVRMYVCLSFFNFLKASHWPSERMFRSRPLIGPTPFPPGFPFPPPRVPLVFY